jgi:serine/threonine-protein kinase HipA
MAITKTDIWVYAHWQGMAEPKCIGILNAQQAKGKKAFSFAYDKAWLNSAEQFLLDPDIAWYAGAQYSNEKENFGVFLDSMPDTWGRTLMKRRATLIAKEKGISASTLYDIDFLLGVFDESRMGALRFKLSKEGPFLDDNNNYPTPPWTSIRELQQSVVVLESDKEQKDIKKWLAILMAPGSSLGGARPKANVLDAKGNLWIAKFPSKNDTINKAAWEYLAYKLAINCGVEMAESSIEKVAGKYHTFFTKRFDRKKKERIHFASAMTMTGNNEDTLKTKQASYLDIAAFIQYNCFEIRENLHELWKRIIFNIAISNTDDHLRNHGFILTQNGWKLSPAYDLNPSIDKDGLAINISMDDNALDYELAKSVGKYFQLNDEEMNAIISKVKKSVSKWEVISNEIGISRTEQQLMKAAFKV